MDKAIEQLLEIQDKDIKIFSLKKQIRSIPEEKEKIKQLLVSAEESTKMAKDEVLSIEKKIKDVEIEISSLKEKMRNLLSKSAEIKKNDEYRALLKEVDQFNKVISGHEDNQLELWEQLEASKAKRKKVEKSFDDTKVRINGAVKDLDVRNENCKKQIEKVQENRSAFSEDIPKDVFSIYQRLIARSAPGKLFQKGVVPLQVENCGGCFLRVTPHMKALLKKQNFAQCENCGVLLYRDM